MTVPWKELITPDDIDIVSPEGQVRCRVKGYYSGKQFIIDDMNVDVQPGDEIRRLLPNGKEEAFLVDDPKFYRNGPFGSHYQVTISRRGSFPRHTGGNYNISISGPNSRVNIGSTDTSTNVTISDGIFSELRRALNDGISDDAQRLQMTELVARLEKAPDKKGAMAAYQALIASAADHMTLLAPFLPALTDIISRLTS